MLSSKQRISKAEFKSFGRGASYHSNLLSLSVYKKQNLTPSQFSFICSKKVAKSAVKRNLLRRRGYNIVQKLLVYIKTGLHFVFSFKKGAEKATYVDIKNGISSLLDKAEVITTT